MVVEPVRVYVSIVTMYSHPCTMVFELIVVTFLSLCSELQSTFHGVRQKFGEEREDLCFKLIRLVT